jgi:hypothetical protein
MGRPFVPQNITFKRELKDLVTVVAWGSTQPETGFVDACGFSWRAYSMPPLSRKHASEPLASG